MARVSRPCDGCGAHVPRTAATAPIKRFCSDACKPRCSIRGCGKHVNCRGWCAFHYTRWKLTGDPGAPLARRQHRGALCEIDGCDSPGRKTGLCASHYAQKRVTGEAKPFRWKWGEGLPRAGRPACPTSVYELAERDGSDCAICGYSIDMTVRRADEGGIFCASIDHIVPWSRGGTHDPGNLQLAHLYCNIVKSDRADFALNSA